MGQTEVGPKTIKQIFEHLYSIYGNPTPSQLKAIKTHLVTTHVVNFPVKRTFHQIECGKRCLMAAPGCRGYTLEQMTDILWEVFLPCGMYNDKYTDFNDLTNGDQTDPNARHLITREYEKALQDPTRTMGAAGCSGAFTATGSMEEEKDAPDDDSLGPITAAFSTLHSTNSELTEQNTELRRQLEEAHQREYQSQQHTAMMVQQQPSADL